MNKRGAGSGFALLMLSVLALATACGGKSSPPAQSAQMDSTTKARMAQSLLNAGRMLC